MAAQIVQTLPSVFALAWACVIGIFPTPAWAAKSCSDLANFAAFKNTFACPLAEGGVVRPPDVCAKSGGGAFDAPRGAGRQHNALDINSAEGRAVLSIKPGRVAVASQEWGHMGRAVIIDHEDGDYSVYGHLASVDVSVNDCVTAKMKIGTVGYSGNAACLKENNIVPHLHVAFIRATGAGLADANKPIATATKNANDWLEFSQNFFDGNVDLGIKNPQTLLGTVPNCLK